MKQLTNHKPKHLINLLGKPFLFYLLKNLSQAGYNEVILVVGYQSAKFGEFLENYQKKLPSAIKITLLDQFKICGENKYGTLLPLKCVKDLVGKENFLMVCGDNLYSVNDLRSFNCDDRYCYIGGFVSEHPEKYGVLVSNNGFLTEIIEKPAKFVGNLINAGLYKFTPEIFEKVPQVKLSSRGEYELTDAVSLLAKEGKVKIKRIKEFWFDFGNPADIIKLSRFLEKKSKNGDLAN